MPESVATETHTKRIVVYEFDAYTCPGYPRIIGPIHGLAI